MKVNIILSTYNGERFLAEQIESIQNQTFQAWQLLIRDDGSTDDTLKIIKAFARDDARIHFINETERINLGVIKSFFTLIKSETADVYFFSDQDDVWLPDKLATMLEETQKHDQTKPLMVYMDLSVVDQNLNILTPSMIRTQSHHANTTLLPELTENTVTGGVSMINHALAEKWLSTDDIIMHDWYLALLATATGELVYIDRVGELYRQHENNVLGARTVGKRFELLHQGPKKIFMRYWQLIHDSQAQALKIVNQAVDDVSIEKIELIRKFVDIDQQNIFERVRRLLKYKYTKNQLKHQIVFKLLILTNIFNNNSHT
ncbi:alpha-L-Rha alpha-1,3-L-rhamnosyltransferase [Lactococcus hodotermopsidis]|uniref:Alpha-L-Rha alpha-1,3-L-rhamnosyltransferase n=1 Tax=Pseudolactococcus hodotermopsidis TaxID=2709157 RepID=A0A6A0BDI8_9LACT|nr:glycosyltransferase family 2 protein [Lactococcus hodotermopsidis]GFH42421.1 alpha-L-Rha alpha-1,3-L-rhamnosyltransferase [Lactococcus hodotermopsidis]